LFRPAAIKSGAIDLYLKNRKDPAAAKSDLDQRSPELWKILGESYGALIFQEQVMFILQKIGGFSLAEADAGRKIFKLLDSGRLVKDKTNLYDMLEIDKKGFMSVNKKVANFNKADFIHLLRGLGRRTNQVKSRFDSPILSKSWYGKMLGLFRSWVVPGIRRRYGHGGFTGSTIHTDEELGAVTQGMYVSFFNLLSESVVDGVKSPLGVYDNMSLMEQQNVKRTLVELSSLIAAMALVAALSNLDDDDETYVSNFMLYQAKRFQTEILQWTPIVGTKEAFRILKSPSATLRPIEQAGSLIENIGNELLHGVGIPVADKTIFYQRNTGRFKKGDRKIRKDFEDLMPVLRGLRTTQTPKEKYQWFLNL
jgi:hypothetical protein